MLIQLGFNTIGNISANTCLGVHPRHLVTLILDKSPFKNLTFGIGTHTPDLIFVTQDDRMLTLQGARPVVVCLAITYRIPKLPLLLGVYASRLGAALGDSDRPMPDR